MVLAAGVAGLGAWGRAVDPRVGSLLLNTLWLVVGACAGALPAGTLLAVLLVKTDLPGRRAATALLGVLLVVPLYLQAGAWQAGFGLQGWYTLLYEGPPLLAGWRGAIWIHALAAVPWVALIVGVALAAVEPELEEQALLDGGRAQVFLRVTLRRALAAMGLAGLWVAIAAAGEMTVTNLFLIRTFAEEVYTAFTIGQGAELPLFSTGAPFTLTLAAAGVAACAALSPRGVTLSLKAPRRWPLGRWRWPAALVAWSVVALLLAVPLGSLVCKAGILVEQIGDERVRSWSPTKFVSITLASPGRNRWEFGWSLLIAFWASLAALALGCLLAWRARRGGAAAGVALLVVAAALAVPGPVLGIGLIKLLNRPEIPALTLLYDRSILAPWLAQTIEALPLATLILWHAFATLPDATLESAASEGAGPWTRLWRIALPQRWPAVALAWIAAFILALGELAATLLVAPPGMTTLPIRVFGLIHFGVADQVAGICLALIALLAALAGAGYAVLALARRR